MPDVARRRKHEAAVTRVMAAVREIGSSARVSKPVVLAEEAVERTRIPCPKDHDGEVLGDQHAGELRSARVVGNSESCIRSPKALGIPSTRTVRRSALTVTRASPRLATQPIEGHSTPQVIVRARSGSGRSRPLAGTSAYCPVRMGCVEPGGESAFGSSGIVMLDCNFGARHVSLRKATRVRRKIRPAKSAHNRQI